LRIPYQELHISSFVKVAWFSSSLECCFVFVFQRTDGIHILGMSLGLDGVFTRQVGRTADC
ncbi:hypothetical protein, partial [Citrobacter freundii]|uniref:hypothetical protein n=1 Tax=Citrobacter freundii TaxID=546 RepID=UPI001A954949